MIKVYKKGIYYYVLLASCLITALLSGPALAYVSQNMMRSIAQSCPIQFWLVCLTIIMGILIIFKVIQNICNFCSKKRWICNFQNELISNYINGDYFNQGDPKEILNQIYVQVDTLCNSYLNFSASAFTSLFVVTFSIIYILTVNPLVCLLCLLVVALLAIVRINKGDVIALQKQFMEINNRVSKIQREYILNKEVAPFLTEALLFQHYNSINEKQAEVMIKMNRKKFIVTLMDLFGASSAVILTSVLGGFLCISGKLSIYELFGTIVIIPALASAVFSIPRLYQQYHQITGIWKAFEKLRFHPQYNQKDSLLLEEPVTSVEMRGLKFSYHEKLLIHNLSVCLNSGEIHIVTGESGSGKTTLLKLLYRLLPEESNTIFYNGHPIEKINRKNLWDKIYYVPQNPYILPLTLQDNCLKQIEGKEKEFLSLIRLFDIEKLNTKEKLDPDTLSAGEKQKIYLLRMLLSNKEIWLMDEPTSALDPDSEAVFLTQLKNYCRLKKRLVFIVTHRKETMLAADRIFALEGGILTERGRGDNERE